MAQKSLAMTKVRKAVDKFDELIQDNYVFNLETYYIPILIDLIMQEYDIQLTGQITKRRSRTNPMFYREEFEQALMDFEWIDTGRGYTTLVTPETNTFNWRQGRLVVIENIVEGTIGGFMEVDGEEYVAMYEKPPIIQPFDKTVPRKERIYTLRITGDTRRRWRAAFPKKGMVKYPFSNQPPIDLFDSANQYAEDNIKSWIDEAIKESQKEIVR